MVRQGRAHEVDFSPLQKAIDGMIPANTNYRARCTLNPATFKLEAGVQKKNAECEACGFLGVVKAKYTIRHGVALSVSIRFEPERQ